MTTSRPQLPTPPMRWDGWGDPGQVTELSGTQLAMVRDLLKVSADDVRAVSREAVRLRPSALDAAGLAALEAVVGSDKVSTADADRLPRAGGKSTLDLLRRKDNAEQDAPDAVVLPGSDAEVAELLAVCAERGIAVVPFGGGTSVVGGLDPLRGTFTAVVSLDLRRFDALHELDEVDQTAVLGAGLTGPAAEGLLAAQGFELGHYPQSFRYATIGGFAATRSSGQDSAGFGRFDEMVRGLRVVTTRGVLELGRPGPKNAAGPDLRQLFLGSEGVFGVITAVRVRVHPVPKAKAYEAWTFPDFATGAAALRVVEQLDTGPTVLRLSDEVETALNLATVAAPGKDDAGEPQQGGCLGVTVFEGEPELVAARHDATRRVLERHGGTSLGADKAQRWEAHRFDGPYLRDPLLANGALVETLETATSWSNLAALKQAVTETIQAKFGEYDSLCLVLCHISHVYDTGASLYFTVIGAQRGDAIAQWRDIKAAVNDVLMTYGGTITHHHAVGADHSDWMTDEIGDVGVEILRAVKATLDPVGILNPGKLIP
ncbi:FAD-binding oxidoreductase [Amycolatopsis sp. WAC 01416]|uniref:FAD-binding oxidoreductase n=1 Tax=Amycolatopsis sp. WAC 01416 TaxID=2203196 RepID=UPI001F2061C2|nr:FAD-binding oxidoreductase [Amycolatopsis sp. WAC 01416]